MKAIVGSWDTRPVRFVAELTAMRSRLAEMERELAEERARNADLRELLARIDEREVVLSGS